MVVLSLPILGRAAASPLDGWYGGAAAGMSTVHLTADDWNDGTLSTAKIDNRNIALKAIAGYHISHELAVEISYIHLGNVNFSGFEPGNAPSIWLPGTVFGRATAQGVSLASVLAYPFFKDRFALFAKGGIFMWTSVMKSNPTLSGGTLALGTERDINDDSISWIYGAGAEVRAGKKWHVRLEWEQTTVRFAQTITRVVDLPSLGVTLDF